jgi:hypothetical protein
MSDFIPYTHWAYFPDEASARRCSKDLADYVVRIQEAVDKAPQEWLLLAGRDVEVDRLVERHGEVRGIVTRHGGEYDGGEASYLGTGRPVADPMLTDDWSPYAG